MPSHVAATPISRGYRMAVPGRLVSRRAVAAGPISSAVLRMAPTVTGGQRHRQGHQDEEGEPDGRTGTPRAAARSGLSELSSSGR